MRTSGTNYRKLAVGSLSYIIYGEKNMWHLFHHMNIQNRLAIGDKQKCSQIPLPACWIWYYCDGIHDLQLLILRLLNDLCKNFPNHVNVCLSLQDMRNINCSWLLTFWNVGCLDPTFVYKIWRLWSMIWHLVIKCSSYSTSRHQAHSLCFGSVLGRVDIYRPRSISRSWELALIFDSGMRNLGTFM